MEEVRQRIEEERGVLDGSGDHRNLDTVEVEYFSQGGAALSSASPSPQTKKASKYHVDNRSELMKRGRVIRSYYKETEEVQNADQREELPEIKQSSDICKKYLED